MDVVFEEYCLPIKYGAVAIAALFLLRIFGGRHRSLIGYFFGCWHLVVFSMHMTMDLLCLLEMTGRIKAKEVDHLPSYLVEAIRKMLHRLAEADDRMKLAEFQTQIIALLYLGVIGGSFFSLLAFIGYLRNSKVAYAAQLIVSTIHLCTLYFMFFPEYLDNFKHIKDIHYVAMIYVPFAAIAAFGLMGALCKLCCGGASDVDLEKKTQ